ncbi:hypothetical protein CS063_05025 [Sporanaerobium hydrogeniformans]|uniref:Uncharacterized protein n=1 Tax=Sporanaerobium hydrogeniformans TaxID=3072179 RepID=A0AC61DF24_9FIRM|nr:hypothetical protein [Sporanaerobium hydrogeniformans]PHV71413.1 hypothetical protein CS063_05025 [Sporanaerobium hydrogeniformans]
MEWFKKFMQGRYGVDQLSIFLLLLSLPLSLILAFIDFPYLSLITYVPLILCYLRIFSKNISKRQQENFRFLRYWYPTKKKALGYWSRLKGMKTHRYYHCPQCKQALRVPKGRGNIRITCPKCKAEFSKRT